LQVTEQEPSQSAAHCVASAFDLHPASQWPEQSASQAPWQSNFPGSTVHSPLQLAMHEPLQSTLGSLLQLASQLAAKRALQTAVIVSGVQRLVQSRLGGTTSHFACALTNTSLQAPMSAKAGRAVNAIAASAPPDSIQSAELFTGVSSF
jgi:hypothetical protein